MPDGLARTLQQNWAAQRSIGFVLGDPDATVETRVFPDPATGVAYRFRWLPHREIRSVPGELERRGILDPQRDESLLFRDPRDASGRHCFLCLPNVAICHPAETLVPISAGGRRWQAGANFAWLGRDHYTVIAEEHVDQLYSRQVLDAMLDLYRQTTGVFRIVFNGAGAGATIPWHLHLQIVSDPFPIETLRPGGELAYPSELRVFPLGGDTADRVHTFVAGWEAEDPTNHRVNLLVAPHGSTPAVFVTLRDARHSIASNKGLMGGWEVAGDFAYSEPDHRIDFDSADLETALTALEQIRPPARRAGS
jgi:hypothetical protein